ncbi:MAG: holo-ACP synthase [Deltaproteobacteria bacterium]|nr:holo-ACP synthase [Deltaproteobacteria bacterium]NCP01872.1 holo-ACP synthase [Deltaproteobacteria bacterium]NCP78497.1 holo-ACP synthase [Desulfuromonadales bacterium]
MAIVGCGIDLAKVSRFQRLIDEKKRALLERLFTPTELDYALAFKRGGEHLAARFAAKEAFLKALGTGLRFGLSWQQLEVCRDELGCPRLRASGQALEMLTAKNGARIHLSYSHDGEYAVAQVILED